MSSKRLLAVTMIALTSLACQVSVQLTPLPPTLTPSMTPTATDTPEPSATPAPTDTPEPSATPEQTSTPGTETVTATASPETPGAEEGTPTDTPTPELCEEFALLTPARDEQLPAHGEYRFSWTEVTEAKYYLLEITAPSGPGQVFKTENTGVAVEMGNLPLVGDYTWQVTPLDADEEPLCPALEGQFSK
jgi:hypothetical protein